MGFFSEVWEGIKGVAAPVVGLLTGNPWLSLGASALLGGSSSGGSSDYSSLLSGAAQKTYTPSIPNLFEQTADGGQGLGTAYMQMLQQQLTNPQGLTGQQKEVQMSQGMSTVSAQAQNARSNLMKHFAQRGMLRSGALGGAMANVETGRMNAAANLSGQVNLADAAAQRQQQANAMSGIANLIGVRETAASGASNSAMQLAQLQLAAQQAAEANDTATYNQLMQAISSIYQATNQPTLPTYATYPNASYNIFGQSQLPTSLSPAIIDWSKVV